MPEISIAITTEEALARLKAGNAGYAAGKSAHPRVDAKRRRALSLNGQEPIACVLGCADSRVPPEIVFDQGLGDLFVVRIAGNVCEPLAIASVEYAVAKLHTPLLVVLGHAQCGAVQAAIDKAPLPGSLPGLVELIAPAVEAAERQMPPVSGADLLLCAVKQNVLNSTADLIARSNVIRSAVGNGALRVVGAVAHIKDGSVEWLAETPAR